MLGLGNSLISSSSPIAWSPKDVGTLQMWFKAFDGIFAQFNAGGDTEYNPLTTGSNLEDDDRVTRWVGRPDSRLDFYQEGSNDMPRYEIAQGVEGSLHFPNAAKFMNLVETGTTTPTFVALPSAFTVLIRCQPTSLTTARGILGQTSSETEFIRFGAGASNLDDSVRMKIDNTAIDFTGGGSDVFPTNEFTNLLIERSSSNVCKMYVYSNTYKDSASGTEWGNESTKSGTATFDNLGCQDDDSTNFQGYISDVIIWSSQLTAEERELAFKYTGL